VMPLNTASATTGAVMDEICSLRTTLHASDTRLRLPTRDMLDSESQCGGISPSWAATSAGRKSARTSFRSPNPPDYAAGWNTTPRYTAKVLKPIPATKSGGGEILGRTSKMSHAMIKTLKTTSHAMIKTLKTTSRAVWRWLNRLVRPSAPQLIERLYDEKGRLLWEKPYLFRCLFSEGQGMIAESVPMTILSCRLDGDIVTTRVKLHKPWPNANVDASPPLTPQDNAQR